MLVICNCAASHRAVCKELARLSGCSAGNPCTAAGRECGIETVKAAQIAAHVPVNIRINHSANSTGKCVSDNVCLNAGRECGTEPVSGVDCGNCADKYADKSIAPAAASAWRMIFA